MPWSTITPDRKHCWIIPENADEYATFQSLADLFGLYTVGVKTNRDDVVYDWDRERLAQRMRAFITSYNAEVYRHKIDLDADWPAHLKWSETLKSATLRALPLSFDQNETIAAIYRPFTKKLLYFDRILNERVYQWPRISGVVIWVKIGSAWPFFALLSNVKCDLLPQGGSQCFPLSHLNDSALDGFKLKYKEPSLTKDDVFHYIYAILHQPVYRERYADNLKRELPRIPFAPDFHALASAGKELARLHLDYESLEPWPLKYIEKRSVPFSERVTKMKLSKDRTAIQVNESLTLAGIPPEAFTYKLGSKSALEWIIDQYQVKGDSDPNRENDPGYIVRLVGQVTRVSIETMRIVHSLPALLPQK